MSDEAIAVHAVWDDEAGGWTATSRDLPGLRVEAPTYEELIVALQHQLSGRELGDREVRIQASGFPGCGC